MSTVHRLLDDAFAGLDLTPEVQDLKEEIRTNLEARAREIQTSGASPDDAARRAFDELGDVRALVDPTDARPAGPRPDATATQRAAQAARLHKVRPRAGFVVGVVLASLVGGSALVVAALGATGAADLTDVAVLTAVAVTALAAGWVTGASLAQETTTNHPLPTRRATGYGLGAGLVVLGAGLACSTALLPLATGWYVPAGLLLVAGVCLLSALGATQTNRRKAWARDAAQAYAAGNRFEQDPAAAARFGIYTAATWTVAAAVFLGIGFAGGWAWAWLTFVAASGGWLFLLARMLFGTSSGDDRG